MGIQCNFDYPDLIIDGNFPDLGDLDPQLSEVNDFCCTLNRYNYSLKKFASLIQTIWHIIYLKVSMLSRLCHINFIYNYVAYKYIRMYVCV